LSPEYLHHVASGRGSSDGVLFPDIVKALENPGQPSEADCPYHPGGLPAGWTPPKGVSLYRWRSDLNHPEPDEIEALLSTGVVGLGTTGAMRCFLIRNSWGTGWGDDGHAWLDDAFVNQHLRHLLALTDEVT